MKNIDVSTLDLKDKVVTINRVTKIVKGGRTMSFTCISCCRRRKRSRRRRNW